jgi:alkylation response protein AidB-like acyl-CoA dehydrogenase
LQRTSVRTDERETHLARVERVARILAAGADEAERRGRLTEAMQTALLEAGLFRLLLPRPYKGLEVDLPTFFAVIEAVAKVDASAAWCLCQGNGCAMTAAYLEPAIADKIWTDDPRAVLAWGPGPRCQAVADGTGYRLTGRWSFASGGRHATWLGGHADVIEADGAPRRNTDGSHHVRTLLFPAEDAIWHDVWDVIGLRGTGSDTFETIEYFVRHDHSVERDTAADRRYQAPLYVFPAMSAYATGFSATALGIARTMLDSFVELALDKTPRMAHGKLRDNGMVQFELGHAEARLRGARAYVLDEVEGIWAQVLASGQLSVEQRMRIRLATTFAIHEAKGVADTAYDLAGATAIFARHAFERRFRDIHTVAQQLQGRKTHFQTVGAFLLGHPPDLSVV